MLYDLAFFLLYFFLAMSFLDWHKILFILLKQPAMIFFLREQILRTSRDIHSSNNITRQQMKLKDFHNIKIKFVQLFH